MINLVYFKTLLSIVEWKHVLNKIFPDNIYKFYTFFVDFTVRYFQNKR